MQIANPVVYPFADNIFAFSGSTILLFSVIALIIWFVSNLAWVRNPRLSAINAVVLTLTGLFVSYATLSLPYSATYLLTIVMMSAVLFVVTKNMKKTMLIMMMGIILSLFAWSIFGIGPLLGMMP